jgi:hypothetical protein
MTLARQTPSYKIEAWTTRRHYQRRLISAEMCFIRTAAEYTPSDHKRNKEIMKELHTPHTKFIEKYRRNWKEHVGKMNTDRIPKKIFKVSIEKEKKFRKTFEMMEGLSCNACNRPQVA